MQLPQDEGVGRGDFNRKPEFVLPDQVCICRGQLVNLLSKGQAAEGEGKQGCECEDLSGNTRDACYLIKSNACCDTAQHAGLVLTCDPKA